MKNVYFSNLNGFRGLAALAVIFAHISYWIPSPKSKVYEVIHFLLTANGSEGGRLGVIFFFILSGFLITFLLINEIKEHKKIHFLFFYLRRLFRIWPLYFLVVLIGFFIYPLFTNQLNFHESASVLLYVSFLANYDHIYNYFPSCSILGVQWSVSVEEQFYIFWPILISFISKTKYFLLTLLGLIFLSELFYLFVGVRLRAGEYHLLSCMKYLASGSLLAYCCYNQPIWFNKITFFIFHKKTTVLFYLVSSLIIFLQNTIIDFIPSYKYFLDIVPVIFFMFIILEQNYSKFSFYKIGKSRFLEWLGKISYGLYLLHMIVINFILVFLPQNENYFLWYTLLTLTLTILLSHFTFNYFESYFLKFNRKYKLISSDK
jgi:peptidoglycan/LPS O-acetylase OafA/YrhL